VLRRRGIGVFPQIPPTGSSMHIGRFTYFRVFEGAFADERVADHKVGR